MDENRKISMMKVMIDDPNEADNVLSVYLELAKNAILNQMYPYKDDYTGLEIPEKYDSVQLKVGCYLYLRRGTEGQIQHIENGIHRNYGSADIPKDMLKDVVPFCQAIR